MIARPLEGDERRKAVLETKLAVARIKAEHGRTKRERAEWAECVLMLERKLLSYR